MNANIIIGEIMQIFGTYNFPENVVKQTIMVLLDQKKEKYSWQKMVFFIL